MTRPGLSILIPAAGAGLRLGEGPKDLRVLDGRPIIRWLADKCLRLADEVVVAAPPDHLATLQSLLPDCRVVAGGASRQESLHRLFDASRGERLALLDAARPFTSRALIERVLAACAENGCAGAFLSPEVPVATLVNGFARDARPGHAVGVFQTPQCYSREVLQDMLEKARRNGWQTQSAVQLALLAGYPVAAVAGEKANIKITTREDWLMAQSLTEYLR